MHSSPIIRNEQEYQKDTLVNRQKTVKDTDDFLSQIIWRNFFKLSRNSSRRRHSDFHIIIYNIDIFMLSVSAFSDILIIDQVIGLGLALAMVHIQAGVFLAIFLYGRT